MVECGWSMVVWQSGRVWWSVQSYDSVAELHGKYDRVWWMIENGGVITCTWRGVTGVTVWHSMVEP